MSIELREGVNSVSPVSVKGGGVGLCRRLCKNQSKHSIFPLPYLNAVTSHVLLPVMPVHQQAKNVH